MALLFTGCHRAVTDPKDPKFIVAEKGDLKITRAELDKEVDTYLKQHQVTAEQVGPSKMPMLETAMLDNIVLKDLLLAKAATLQLKDVDKEETAALDMLKQRVPPGQDFDQQLKAVGITLDELKQRIHEEVVINKVLQAEAFKNVDPTEQEINDFYLKNKEHFDIPEKMRASRILVLVDDKASPADKAAKKKAIDAARARVAKGEDFSKVASQVSEDRYSAPKGGDIGFFQRGENDPQFDDVVFKLKPGTLSPVFLTPLGYQFVKVTDSQPAGVVPVADARGAITNYLRKKKQAEQEQAYTKKLLDDGGVTFHLVRVDMPKPGAPAPGGAPAPAEAPTPAPAAATPPSASPQ